MNVVESWIAMNFFKFLIKLPHTLNITALGL